MNHPRESILCGVLAVMLLLCGGAAAEECAPQPCESEEGFESMFNGEDLSGWEGLPGAWWVEDGAITAESTPEQPCTQSHYLMWRGGEPADFELRLKYRISGEGGNSGIQVRSLELPDWDTYGYQADFDVEGQWTGALFEHKRGGIAMRGEDVTIDADGTRHVASLGDADELLRHVHPDDWNEYHVLARGNEVVLSINGVRMARVVDNEEGVLRKGVIGLQKHAGPPMRVQFKDLRIRCLDDNDNSTSIP